MSQAAETLDGWYSLHLFYAVDWASLRLVPKDERDALVTEFQSFLENTATVRSSKSGDQAIYNITGQKADLLLWFLRPEMKSLNHIENEFNKLRIADFL
ncbi:chlorite dismutase family protein, partial [Staphylococcus aureus]|nr:chlorite dismutase family protein [Staphylococcus aureus]